MARNRFACEFLAERFRQQVNDAVAQSGLVLKRFLAGQAIKSSAKERSQVVGQRCVAVAGVQVGAFDRNLIVIQCHELSFEKPAGVNAPAYRPPRRR